MNSDTTFVSSFDELIDSFELFLFDAYGVLVTSDGVLPGAEEAMHRLSAAGKSYKIVTNDASRSMPEQVARYQSFGFPVQEENIVSSGSLVADYFHEHGLLGAPSMVLGPTGAHAYVNAAGGEVVEFSIDAEPEVVVLLNESDDIDLSSSLNILLSVILKQLHRGIVPHLLVANPDLNYPSSPSTFGLAPGSYAMMLEASINNNYRGSSDISFVRLGKPFVPIFKQALGETDPSRTVFFGDQFATDILGANQAGITSVLLLTGVSRPESVELVEPRMRPSYVLRDLKSA